MAEKTTTLTLTNEFGEYTITVKKTEMPMYYVVDELIRPVLMAAGYTPGLVELYIPATNEG